ncbi:MAG: HAD-IIA family hydrolase [Halobacteriota archaeon]
MNAIILAENDNRALRPLNSKKPGALIKINGIPLLEHQIRSYLKAGVAEASIAVISGYRHNAVKHFLSRAYPAVHIIKNADYRLKNAAFSLHLAFQTGEFNGARLLISSGECLYDGRLIDALMRPSTNAIAGDTKEPGGDIRVAERGRVISVGETKATEASIASSVYVVKFNARTISALKRAVAKRSGETNVSMATVLNDLVKTVRATLVDIGGMNWAHVRSTEDLHDADKRFSRFNLSNTHCFVLDLDGTVYVGARPIRGTVEFIERNAYKKAFYFVTNNTSKLTEDYRLRLSALGITTDSDHVITPLAPLIEHLRVHSIQNVYLIGNVRLEAYLLQELPELRLTADPDACEALIVAYDTELTYDKLRDAAVLLQQNPRLPFLATHGDLVCPTEDGFVPDCGCFLTMLEQTTGRRPDVVFGKPSAGLVGRATERCGRDHMAIVGDRLYTDGRMARNVGCSYICVLSGETTREQIDGLCEDEFPSLIVRDLGDLLSFPNKN